jgi:hypothetical protein
VGAVATVHFESGARFEHDDLLLMTRTLRTLLDTTPLDDWPPGAADGVSGALKWLLASLGLAGVPPVRRPVGRPGASAARSSHGELGRNVLVDLATEQVLDHAASLLDASALLHGCGLHVYAFALEGIQGRLLEATVGAGSVERPW